MLKIELNRSEVAQRDFGTALKVKTYDPEISNHDAIWSELSTVILVTPVCIAAGDRIHTVNF